MRQKASEAMEDRGVSPGKRKILVQHRFEWGKYDSIDPEIREWVNDKIDEKGFISVLQDRDDFVSLTGKSKRKFAKWMRRAGLVFSSRSGRWTQGSE